MYINATALMYIKCSEVCIFKKEIVDNFFQTRDSLFVYVMRAQITEVNCRTIAVLNGNGLLKVPPCEKKIGRVIKAWLIAGIAAFTGEDF